MSARRGAPLLGALLPEGAYGAEETGDPEPAGLFPEEAALVARATPAVERTAAAGRVGLTSFHFVPRPPSARI
ncbi:hypothetical protein ACWDNT_18975, partial [Streptomyces sp. NPDC000963]